MRKIVVPVLAGLWGLAMLGRAFVEGIPSPDSAYGAGRLIAFLTGVLAVVLVGRLVLRTRRARTLGVVALLACVAGAATVGDSDAALADCTRDFAAGLASRQPGLDEGAARSTASRFCGGLAARDLLDATEADVNIAVSQDPAILHPLCDHSLRAELGLAAAAARRLALARDIHAFGKAYCDRAVEAGYLYLGHKPTPLELDQLYEAEPGLARDACFLFQVSDLAANPLHGVPLEHAKRAARRYCAQMVERDLLDWAGEGHTAQEQQQIAALCRSYIAELTQGQEGCSV